MLPYNQATDTKLWKEKAARMGKDSNNIIKEAEANYALLTQEQKEKVQKIISDLIKTQCNQ